MVKNTTKVIGISFVLFLISISLLEAVQASTISTNFTPAVPISPIIQYSLADGQTSPDAVWFNHYNGHGSSGVKRENNGNYVFFEYPIAATFPGVTHANLVTSVEKYTNFTLSVDVRTDKQLRQNSPPNTWESAWIFFRSSDDFHHYYFTLKTNGYEFGKKDNDRQAEEQFFLATGDTPKLQIGKWSHWEITVRGNHITIFVDGIKVVDYVDVNMSTMLGVPGSIGLYNEDAEVSFDNVSITSDTATPPITRTDTMPPTTSATPSGGKYTTAQLVTLSANEPATIYYTIDGTTPTTSSMMYSSPVSIPTTLKFFAVDAAGNIESIHTQVYTIVSYPIIHMKDTTATYGLSTYSGRPIHAEYVTSSSQLVGDKIDAISLRLTRAGHPTGIAQIGVFNSDLTVKKLFGTIDVAKIPRSYTDYTFALGPTDLYTIQSGDRIGIKFTGGDSTNFIYTMTDQNNNDPFDDDNSYHTFYTTSWTNRLTKDLTMTLTQTH